MLFDKSIDNHFGTLFHLGAKGREKASDKGKSKNKSLIYVRKKYSSKMSK